MNIDSDLEDKPRLIFVQTKSNKHSLMALAGAIEKNIFLKELRIEFVRNLRNIKANKKTILAFSFMTANIFAVKKEIVNLKKRFPESVFIAGGPHPSGDPEGTLMMGFDYCFVGEGEETLTNFLLNWQKGRLPSQRIIKSEPVDIRKYKAVSPKFKLFGPLEISRGCPFACRFCQTTYIFGRLRHRTLDQIIWAVKEMTGQGFEDIRFITPNLLAYGSVDGFKPNLSALERMLSGVRKIKGVRRIFAGTFPSEIRPEQITKAALGIIKKYCDNDNIIIGAQTGSERMLKRCHRGHTTKDVYQAVELALGSGFKVNIDFIFGMPGETAEDEQKTKKMILELVKKAGVRIHGHFFLPLPGTPWGQKQPKKISQEFREFLLDLRKKGKEYGDWQKQEEMAFSWRPTLNS